MSPAQGSIAAWTILSGLPAWRVTEIPRPSGDPERGQRMMALASAARSGSPVAFGWARATDSGPVTVIAAGRGMSASEEGAGPGGPAGPVPLGYPAGATGKPLAPGALTGILGELACWMPVAITPDALLADLDEGTVSLDKGLKSWRSPFGWLVVAAPIGSERRGELIDEVSLVQLMADRHDSPRAKQAAVRSKARHDELKQAAVTGLWDIWLLAGGASPAAAARVAGLLCGSLNLKGLPFGLTEQPGRCASLRELLGAPDQAAPQREPGPLARDVLDMYGDQPAGPSGFPDENGFATWAPTPAPGWAPAAASASGNNLTPEFPEPEPEFPCAASSRLLAALAMPPAKEIPGVRMILEPDFDVTPETAYPNDNLGGGPGKGGPGSDTVGLGTVLDASRAPSWPLSVTRGSLNRHTFVCGATGAGKSQTVRHLLESATAAQIPWLVIEPAKAEYRLMAARLPDARVITIRPGDPDTVPAGINPLEPPAGPGGDRFPLQAHADLVRALFLAAFQAEEPFPQVLAGALTRCYEEAGWDLVSGEPKVPGAAFPALADLRDAAMAVVSDIGYGQEVRDNIRGFVKVRIGSLRAGTTGRFLGNGFPLDYARLMDGNVVLEIEDCGDDTDKAFLTGAVLIRLTEHLRMRARAETAESAENAGNEGGPSGLRHLTVIEEAHRLLRQPPEGAGAGAAAKAVEMFADLLAEIRAYGEGLIIAEQIPSKLIVDAIKNTAVKVVHRLPAQDDRDTVGATMNLTASQSRFLVTLKPGEAAVFTDGMDYPVLARMPDGSARERVGAARPASPAGLITGTRPACPPGCARQACTLRQVSAAARTAADPRITLWAELTVAAHLAGWTMPMPGPALTADLDDMDKRHRDCALAHAVGEAVAVRVPAFSARVAAPDLAAHVAAAMRVPLEENRWLCAESEPQWTAPSFLWGRVLSDLRKHEADHPGQGPHPSTQQWEAACGTQIPGATCAEQAAVVQQRSANARKDPRTVRTVLLGSRDPSAIEHAVGTTAADPGWKDALATAITVLSDCDWVTDALAAPGNRS